MTRTLRLLRLGLVLIASGLVLAGCDEKRVDKTPGSGGKDATPSRRTQSPVQQAADRAAAATQRLQDAQNKANSTEQEKEDAVRQFEAERKAITDAAENPPPANDGAPPPL